MNKQLQEFARQQLKEGLAALPENNQTIFKRMYSFQWKFDGEGRSFTPNGDKADLDKPISDVVDDMPEDKLDWAMQQVENSLIKHRS